MVGGGRPQHEASPWYGIEPPKEPAFVHGEFPRSIAPVGLVGEEAGPSVTPTAALQRMPMEPANRLHIHRRGPKDPLNDSPSESTACPRPVAA